MSRLVTLPVLAILAACGGGSDGPEVTWRLPCGGTGSRDGVAEYSYRYEHDDLGNQTLTELTELATSTVRSTYVRTYEGHEIVTADYTSPSLSYLFENQIEGGRIQHTDFMDRITPGSSYAYTWTWRDGQLERVDYDYVSPDLEDSSETYEAIDGGFASTQCTPSSLCDYYEYLGPKQYVGDFDHYNTFTADLGQDATIDYRYERTVDSHGLDLTTDTFFADDTGTLVHEVHDEYERESDGTALRRHSTTLTSEPPSTFTVEYQFECN